MSTHDRSTKDTGPCSPYDDLLELSEADWACLRSQCQVVSDEERREIQAQNRKDEIEYYLDCLKNTIVDDVLLLLAYVSDDLRDERDLVKAALQHNGLNLEFASARLKSDSELVAIACKQNPDAIKFASL